MWVIWSLQGCWTQVTSLCWTRRGRKLTDIAHQPGQPSLYQRLFLGDVYIDHTSVSWKFSPSNGPEPTLLLALPVQETSLGLPLTSLGAELGPHWPGVLGPGVPGSGRNCLERPVNRFPKSPPVPWLWAGIMLQS